MASGLARLTLIALAIAEIACGPNSSTTTNVAAPSGPQTAVAASITAISPASLVAGSGHQTVTVTGTNFAAGLTMAIASAGGAATTVSGSDISSVTPTSFQASVVVATAGAYSVQVTNPGAAASNAVSLQVTTAPKAAPTIASITPAVIVASSSPQVITVRGTNFAPGLSLAYALGTGSTSIVTGSQIANVTSTSFDATLTIFPGGTYTFSVTNPDAIVSNPVTETVAGPSAQAATLFSVSPSTIVVRPNAQTLQFAGQNFALGLTMVATSDGGVTVTASGSQIASLTSQSFSATVTISTAGRYTLQVINPGAAPSNALSEDIPNPNLPAFCAAGAPPPYVGNINGLPVPQVVFSESATGVGFYAQIYENWTPSILCGGGLSGPCPWLDACTVGGACQGPVQVLCGCISGGLEVHFARTAPSGTCSANITVHDECFVQGTTTLTFTLPPPSTPFAALMRALDGLKPAVPVKVRR